MRTFQLLILTWSLSLSLGRTVHYDLTISYFNGAPDGVPKRVLGINGNFPGPTLRATIGDWLEVNVINRIQDGQGTTIHFHGIEMRGHQWQDGPRMLTQCDIPSGANYTYRFPLEQSGTYWYHAHHGGQYSEGLWGILIVDNSPEVYEYDGDFLLTFSDWYHFSAHELASWYNNNTHSKGEMPCPDSMLTNGIGYYPCDYAEKQNITCAPENEEKYPMLEVERGKTYRIRVANPSTFTQFQFGIDGHQVRVIEADGVDIVETEATDRYNVSTGTRYSFLVTMNGDSNHNQFWIRARAALTPIKRQHPNINPYPEALIDHPWKLAVLKYKNTGIASKHHPVNNARVNPNAKQGRPEIRNARALQRSSEHPILDGFTLNAEDPLRLPLATKPFPDTPLKAENWTLGKFKDLVPYGGEKFPTYVNQTIVLNAPDMDDPNGPEIKPGFNFTHYNLSSLDKPALVKLMHGEQLPLALNPIRINGFGDDYIVEIRITDMGSTGHPYHMHGHTFWVMGQGLYDEGPLDPSQDAERLDMAVRKETINCYRRSWLVIRFRANNPGIWLFHCHVNFHFDAGLGLVFVEGEEYVKDFSIPNETKDLCSLSGISLDTNNSAGERQLLWSLPLTLFLVVAYFYKLY